MYIYGFHCFRMKNMETIGICMVFVFCFVKKMEKYWNMYVFSFGNKENINFQWRYIYIYIYIDRII